MVNFGFGLPPLLAARPGKGSGAARLGRDRHRMWAVWKAAMANTVSGTTAMIRVAKLLNEDLVIGNPL